MGGADREGLDDVTDRDVSDRDVSDWDARYAEREQVWSGNPNTALVAEAGDLRPGRALDVGCGEGADAVWLARRGWDVTALDVSQVALARAVAAAGNEGVSVRWLCSGLLEAPLDPGRFDLVAAHYPALRRTDGAVAEHALLDLVAAGGTLLLVHHADFGAHHGDDHPDQHRFDPEDYVHVEDVHALLGAAWAVEVYERRARDVRTGAGAGHTHDVVLRARRRA